MFSTTDTIAAIATPPGRGGIGIVRLSGPDAHAIVRRLIRRDVPLRPRHATFASIRTSADAADALDQVVVTWFPRPQSYTGDDVVEIGAHGSPVILQAIVEAAMSAGARLAAPGEFTLRAFLNGRIDLTQAEAVADLIDAATPAQARAAFDQLNGTLTGAIARIDASLLDLVARLEASVDFPEEGYHFVEPGALAVAIDEITARVSALIEGGRKGRLLREGLQVAILGAPNAGKSSLFNALVGAARAIVTDIPGTTRDLVSEVMDLRGLRVTLVDTAGLRDTADPVEVEGVSRAHAVARTADLVLLVEDGSAAPPALAAFGPEIERKLLRVATKADLPPAWERRDHVAVSALTGSGLDALLSQMTRALDVDPLTDRPAITNVRHLALLEQAQASLARARQASIDEGGRSMSEEFVLADLQGARDALEAITGRRTTDDVLAHIFARFCIGK
jgi:tRNA modification GTPase